MLYQNEVKQMRRRFNRKQRKLGILLMLFLFCLAVIVVTQRIDEPPRTQKTTPLQMTKDVQSAKKAVQTQPQILTHTVRQGETLYSIAAAYGTDVASIVAANGLANPHNLQPGQQLKLLNTKGVIHTVKQGETLWSIARFYQLDVPTIMAANGLQDEFRLQSGQELILPGAKPKPAGVVEQADKSDGSLVFALPTHGKISSRFGYRWGRMHEGIDLAAPTGTPVYAADGGVVTFAGWQSGYGKTVIIDHGNGVETLYGHNSELLVKKGTRVAKGTKIAKVGNTGRSTGPHLHFEVRVNGKAVNPAKYL